MYTLIVLLPLVGFIVAGLFGNRIGAKASEYVTSGLLIAAALLSWIGFLSFGGETQHVQVLQWMKAGTLDISWQLRIDRLTLVMLVVVNTVSALVHVYSIGYMHHDDSRPRFFAYLSLFTFAMLTLVTADNLVQMFFGWEGVGLASYLLIGFWYQKPSANAAAMKAFVVNRVGDFGFLLGIFGLFMVFGSANLDTIFAGAGQMVGTIYPEGGGAAANAAAPILNFAGYSLPAAGAMTAICLLLFMGAMGKSAQIGLHTWLPDAMEGPTPVSALIHAATMVTAGVFMLARLSPVFELSHSALTFVTFIGATTAFFAATIGLVQNDIKRVIAYSTCSQLGYMFVALGVGAYGAAIFHLFTHAFFKALLFLGAGSVIHAVDGEQDMRHMGGLRKHIPITYWTMMIGTLALTGFPFTAGYYSKDAIIESAFAGENAFAMYGYMMTVIAAALTSFYSWRLVFLTFHGKPRASHEVMHHVHESPLVMTTPLFILSAGALLAGIVFYPFFLGGSYETFWHTALFAGPENHILHEAHEVPALVVWSPTIAMVLGFVVAYIFYIRQPQRPAQVAARNPSLYKFLLNKWYFDELYDVLFVRSAKWLGRFLWKKGDVAVIDRLGPDGISARALDVTGWVVRLQTGYLYHYAFVMLIGVAALVTFMMFGGMR
ncbi:NADH-quinone oxidoreductase subunit L [Aureimonas phyllosphaerae]|uniref:NADH-quinone oxidoreductase subunit L n=1 Tax=Aureimonas phyllosphaerae TaxID=1166078 RepID=A0A7W6BNT9_9HYPH|nr:NADH-quinone oxidoreductase subunit L [Aureimonas phyllosphaerae]MBB3935331.1 NADH-quinone oxidoreductase subunit L [Aureimonas phyllosphaerae]MBB3959339.1 NADH-quinone oxidoreductase subunit L [Aureimonas phyllosphaerae]SFF04449.1 NADH dehydrogenase subunit L [Aureimonas phyllosphaerae]